MSAVNADDEQLRWVPTHVQVTVLRARGLRAKGKHGTSDVYIIIQVAKEKYSTCVMEKTTSPEWAEECVFELLPGVLEPGGRDARPPGSCDLTLTAMHRALMGLDVFLGQVVIPLDRTFQGRICMKNEWFKFQSKSGKKEKERGELQVTVQFTRHNLTASMYDLSMKEKPHSAFSKLKQRIRGKKRVAEEDSSSAIIPGGYGALARMRGRLPSDGGGEEDYEDDEGGEARRSKMRNFFLRGRLRKSSDTRSSTSLGSESSESSSRGGSLSPTAGISVVVSDLSNSPSNSSNFTADNSPEHTVAPSPQVSPHKHIADGVVESPLPSPHSGPKPLPQLSIEKPAHPKALPSTLTPAMGSFQKVSALSLSLQNLSISRLETHPGPMDGRRWSLDKAGDEERAEIAAALEQAGKLEAEERNVTEHQQEATGDVEVKKQKRGLFSHCRSDLAGKTPITGKDESALPSSEGKHRGWFNSKDLHNKPSQLVCPCDHSTDTILYPLPSCLNNPFTSPVSLTPSNPFLTLLQQNPFFEEIQAAAVLTSNPPALPCFFSPTWFDQEASPNWHREWEQCHWMDNGMEIQVGGDKLFGQNPFQETGALEDHVWSNPFTGFGIDIEASHSQEMSSFNQSEVSFTEGSQLEFSEIWKLAKAYNELTPSSKCPNGTLVSQKHMLSIPAAPDAGKRCGELGAVPSPGSCGHRGRGLMLPFNNSSQPAVYKEVSSDDTLEPPTIVFDSPAWELDHLQSNPNNSISRISKQEASKEPDQTRAEEIDRKSRLLYCLSAERPPQLTSCTSILVKSSSLELDAKDADYIDVSMQVMPVNSPSVYHAPGDLICVSGFHSGSLVFEDDQLHDATKEGQNASKCTSSLCEKGDVTVSCQVHQYSASISPAISDIINVNSDVFVSPSSTNHPFRPSFIAQPSPVCNQELLPVPQSGFSPVSDFYMSADSESYHSCSSTQHCGSVWSQCSLLAMPKNSPCELEQENLPKNNPPQEPLPTCDPGVEGLPKCDQLQQSLLKHDLCEDAMPKYNPFQHGVPAYACEEGAMPVQDFLPKTLSMGGEHFQKKPASHFSEDATSENLAQQLMPTEKSDENYFLTFNFSEELATESDPVDGDCSSSEFIQTEIPNVVSETEQATLDSGAMGSEVLHFKMVSDDKAAFENSTLEHSLLDEDVTTDCSNVDWTSVGSDLFTTDLFTSPVGTEHEHVEATDLAHIYTSFGESEETPPSSSISQDLVITHLLTSTNSKSHFNSPVSPSKMADVCPEATCASGGGRLRLAPVERHDHGNILASSVGNDLTLTFPPLPHDLSPLASSTPSAAISALCPCPSITSSSALAPDVCPSPSARAVIGAPRADISQWKRQSSNQRSSPHLVKPLTPPGGEERRSEGRSVLEKLKSTIHPGRSHHHGDQETDRAKGLVEGGGSYYHLAHSELVSLLVQREVDIQHEREEFERQGLLLEKREAELRKTRLLIRDLEDYIDTLLVRIMEQTPTLLQVRGKLK
uniref:Rab11 family-interacting protein 5 n=1 Tax=Denticeps clupeoides TaxID=299321 RepID=A0AAY4ESU1_9TELE